MQTHCLQKSRVETAYLGCPESVEAILEISGDYLGIENNFDCNIVSTTKCASMDLSKTT